MQETIIATDTVMDEEGCQHIFRYILLTRKNLDAADDPVRYGVQIEEVGGETARFADLTERRNQALRLVKTLAKFAVTPINLPEVLEDLGARHVGRRIPLHGG